MLIFDRQCSHYCPDCTGSGVGFASTDGVDCSCARLDVIDRQPGALSCLCSFRHRWWSPQRCRDICIYLSVSRWRIRWSLFLGLCLFSASVGAQQTAAQLFAEHCASCHSRGFQNDQAADWSELVSAQAKGTDERMRKIIAEGIADQGMPGFAKLLDAAQIRSLVVLMREQMAAAADSDDSDQASASAVITSQEHSFVLVPVIGSKGVLWSMSFLPDGDMLLTEKSGVLYRYDSSKNRLIAIAGTPKVWRAGQGGLLDVLVHPNYAENRWIYLAYSDKDSGMTAVVRGRIRKDKWQDQEQIFLSPKKFRSSARIHYGTRMVIHNGYLYFGIGDRGRQSQAQDLRLPNGKIHRLHEDGRVPKDNPFVGEEGHFPTIWTYGNRNPQGLTLHPDGTLWEAEHGPRGGDEINVIIRALNYGWPLVSLGINYDGTPFSQATELEGIQNPLWHWTPSIAVSNLDFYQGDMFPGWVGSLLVASLARQELRRVTVEQQRITGDELLFKNRGRIRDVRVGPEGMIYLLKEKRSLSYLYQMKPPPATTDAEQE